MMSERVAFATIAVPHVVLLVVVTLLLTLVLDLQVLSRLAQYELQPLVHGPLLPEANECFLHRIKHLNLTVTHAKPCRNL